jgi:hypothetical protein
LFYWTSNNFVSTRQGVHAVGTSRLGSFRETISTSTSLRWLAKAHTTTIQRKSSRLVTISNKIYYSQIYLLDSNFIHIGFQLGCMKSFEIPRFMHIANPTPSSGAYWKYKRGPVVQSVWIKYNLDLKYKISHVFFRF